MSNKRRLFFGKVVVALFVSREFDYALRILRALGNNEQLTVDQICDREHTPKPYSYKILKKLEKESMVRGNRGIRGGYQIVVPLQSITLYDVYLAVEENVYVSECMKDGYGCPNNAGGSRCTIHKVLLRMQDQLIQIMRRQSLAEALEKGL